MSKRRIDRPASFPLSLGCSVIHLISLLRISPCRAVAHLECWRREGINTNQNQNVQALPFSRSNANTIRAGSTVKWNQSEAQKRMDRTGDDRSTSTAQHSASQCSAVQCGTVQCSAVRCCIVHSHTVHVNTNWSQPLLNCASTSACSVHSSQSSLSGLLYLNNYMLYCTVIMEPLGRVQNRHCNCPIWFSAVLSTRLGQRLRKR